MKKALIFVANLLLVSSLFVSCEKEEGEGGKGSIVGKVYTVIDDGGIFGVPSIYEKNSEEANSVDHILTSNNKVLSKIYGSKVPSDSEMETLNANRDDYAHRFGKLFHFGMDTVVGVNEDVYIVYGNHEYGCDDKVKTSYNGTYKFSYLNEGNYKIYVCSDQANSKEAIVYDVKVSGSETYGGDFYIKDGKNSGMCGVVGKMEVYPAKGTEYLPAVDHRVYIREVNEISSDDCRVDDAGYYYYGKLKPNTEYVVYTMTEPVKNEGTYPVLSRFRTGNAGSIVPGPTLQADEY